MAFGLRRCDCVNEKEDKEFGKGLRYHTCIYGHMVCRTCGKVKGEEKSPVVKEGE